MTVPSFIFAGRLMKLGGLEVSAANVERAEKPAAPSVKPADLRKSRRRVFMIESDVELKLFACWRWQSSISGQAIARFGSRQLRNLEAFPVFAFDVLVRFAVFEALGLGIEFQRTAQPVGDVADLAVDAREVCVECGY